MILQVMAYNPNLPHLEVGELTHWSELPPHMILAGHPLNWLDTQKLCSKRRAAFTFFTFFTFFWAIPSGSRTADPRVAT